MFDTVQDQHLHLSHDRPCPQCGHAMHTYLACSDSCTCRPVALRQPAYAGR
ncbi:hypothetical protein BH11ACT8_BH11ACT8_23650 [soil metagenome]